MSLNTFTAFCQAANGKGTIWINTVEAEGCAEACQLAAEACAADWECDPENVRCLGLAVGDVEICYWEDIEG